MDPITDIFRTMQIRAAVQKMKADGADLVNDWTPLLRGG